MKLDQAFMKITFAHISNKFVNCIIDGTRSKEKKEKKYLKFDTFYICHYYRPMPYIVYIM